MGVVGTLLLFLGRRVIDRPVQGWAIVYAAAVVVGVTTQFEMASSWYIAIVLLAGAGLLVDLSYGLTGEATRWLRPASWVGTIAGVWWATTWIGLDDPSWSALAFPAMVLLVGSGVWAMGRSSVAGALGPMFAVVVAGAWVTVPETDIITVLAGVAIPLGLATLPWIGGRPSAAGSMALAGVFAWIVLAGGIARPWTIVDAWVAAVSLPLMAAVVSFRRSPPRYLILGVVHVLYVLVVTRIADFTTSVSTVLIGGSLALAAAGAALWWLPGSLRPPDAEPRRAARFS